jgi:hypothetical protein
MEALLAALEASEPAQYLRNARWGYAAVSGAHVLGIALLVGAVVPLNLRLFGFWHSVPREELLRVLVPCAVAGFLLAAVTGLSLFSVRASEYAELGVFQAKLVLIGLAVVSAAAIHRGYGLMLRGASQTRLTAHGLASMTLWLGALACGRLIAFVE